MRFSAPFVAACSFGYPALVFTMPSEMPSEMPAETLGPCSIAESPTANASLQLSSWLECKVNGFFPYPENGRWDDVFAETFSKDLKATFNDTHYNYDGWLNLYHGFNLTLGRNFSPFKHGFINTLGVPNANGDRGGFAYMIGWEGGYHTFLKRDLYFTDAAFALVREINGQRKIVEFRESSNIPNTAPMPEPNEWECIFKGNLSAS